MIYKLKHPERAQALFAPVQDTMILSCLQNVMGDMYADDPENPKAAIIIMRADTPSLKAAIQAQYGERAKKVTRYAIKKETDSFSQQYLQHIVETLSPEYELQLIDETIFNWSRQQPWCKEWTSLYKDYETYRTTGLGVAVLKDKLPVAGASSYSSYREGIEIQVDTKKEYKRQGLAAAACAKLILECLQRGWYPSWDAHNMDSVHLAEKLGYHFDREYTVFEIHGY